MQSNDLILLNRWATQRDAAAFNTLARRHAGLVYATCLRILRNSHDAEEVAQECFLHLAREGGGIRTSLGGWLHTHATRRAIDRARSEQRRARREQTYAAETPDTEEPAWSELEHLVDEAITALPEDFRIPIVAHFLEGQTQAEVAKTLGVSRQTVTHRIKRGVEEVRERLGKQGITVSAAALGSMLLHNGVEAAPATLLTALGKLSVSGTGAVAVGGAGLAFSLKMVAIGLAAIATVAGVYAIGSRAIWESNTRGTDAGGETPAIERNTLPREATTPAGDEMDEAVSPSADTDEAVTDGTGNWRVLTGRVVDEQGNPVGAVPGSGSKSVRLHFEARAGHASVSGGAPISEDGTFLVEPSKSRLQGAVWAYNEGSNRISEPTPFSLTPDGVHDVTLVLRPGATVSGTFLDAAGNELDGFNITISQQSTPFTATVETTSAGTYEFGPIPAGEYTFSVSREPRHNGEASPQAWSHSFHWSPSETLTATWGQRVSRQLAYPLRPMPITGRVVNTKGAPLAGVYVHAHPSFLATNMPTGVSELVVTTDAEGKFVAPVYGPGSYQVRCQDSRVDDLHDGTSSTDAVAGQDGLILKVEECVQISGRVMDAETNEAVQDLKIAARFGDGGFSGHRTDGGHEFTVHVPPSRGATSLTFSAPGYATEEVQLPPIVPGRDISGLLVRMKPGKAYVGQIVDMAGRPIAGAEVLAGSEFAVASGVGQLMATSDETGHFTLKGLPGERAVLVARAERFLPSTIDHDAWKQSGQALVVPLRLGASIEGVVRHGGKPVERAFVLFSNAESDKIPMRRRSVWTDAAGRFAFRGLPGGEASLKVELPKGSRSTRIETRVPVALQLGETTRVDVLIPKSHGAVTGRVLVGNLPAEADVSLQARDAGRTSAQGSVRCTPGGDGAFRFDEVSPGPKAVIATLSGTLRKRTVEFDLADGEEHKVDIRFSPGGAALRVVMGDAFDERHLPRLTLDFADGESLRYGELALLNGETVLEDLPEGDVVARWEATLPDGSTAREDADLQLRRGEETQLTLGVPDTRLLVTVPAPPEGRADLVIVAGGEMEVPDFQAMTINQLERWMRDIGDVGGTVRQFWRGGPGGERLSETLEVPGLEPGGYTFFVLSFPLHGRDEDLVMGDYIQYAAQYAELTETDLSPTEPLELELTQP